MAIPSTPAAALGAVPPSDLGIASGANSTLQRFGGVFGVAIVTAVFAAHGRLGTPAAFDAGFRPALAVAAALSLLGACAALLVRGRRSLTRAASAEPAPVSA
jgi:hypothetical protein